MINLHYFLLLTSLSFIYSLPLALVSYNHRQKNNFYLEHVPKNNLFKWVNFSRRIKIRYLLLVDLKEKPHQHHAIEINERINLISLTKWKFYTSSKVADNQILKKRIIYSPLFFSSSCTTPEKRTVISDTCFRSPGIPNYLINSWIIKKQQLPIYIPDLVFTTCPHPPSANCTMIKVWNIKGRTN